MDRLAVLGALIAAIVSAGDAVACRGPTFEHSVFFDEIPAGNRSQVAVKITIVDVVEYKPRTITTAEATNVIIAGFQLATARVDRVLRGPLIETDFVKIKNMPSSCGPRLGVGANGLVLGEIERDEQGQPQLHLVSRQRGEAGWAKP